MTNGTIFYKFLSESLHHFEGKWNPACKLFFSFLFSNSKSVACLRLNIFVTPNHVLKLWDNVLSLQSVWRFWQDDGVCKRSTSLLKIVVPFLHCLICKSMAGQFSAPDLPTLSNSSHVWLSLSHDNTGLEWQFFYFFCKPQNNNNNENKACIILYWIMTGYSCNSIIKYHAYCIAANKHQRLWDIWIWLNGLRETCKSH